VLLEYAGLKAANGYYSDIDDMIVPVFEGPLDIPFLNMPAYISASFSLALKAQLL
jgi:hypothetical protein